MMLFKRRAFIGSLAALAAAPLACFGAAEDFSVPVLMASLAQVRSARAHFVEKRYLSVLRKPVETMGVLLYEAPGRLEKLVQKPKPERMLLEGDVLTLETDNGRKRKTMSLAEIPQLAALVGALRGTLAGDMEMLARYFTVSLDGPQERWRLTLTPMESSSLVRFVRIFGAGVDLTAVEVHQRDGDRSVMLMKKN
ncbi:MAG: LolA-related protein [Burkholderiales bacterium]